MILIVLIRSCSCFSLASSSSGSEIPFLIYFSRPFSLRMRPILYFQAKKFSRPSNFSSSLVLGAILTSKSLKNEIYQNGRLTLPVDALGGGELVDPTAFWRSLIFSLQILLARLQHCSFSSSVSLQFFWFTIKLGFGLHGDIATQKIISKAQYMHSGRAQISMQADFQSSNFCRNPNFFQRERMENFTL